MKVKSPNLKLKIGAKISLGFVVMLVLLVVLGSSSYFTMSSSKANVDEINTASQRLLLEMKIENTFKDGVAAIRGFIAYGDEKYYETVKADMDNVLQMENQLLEMVMEEQKPEIIKLVNATTEYRDGLLNDLSPVVREQHKELAAGNAEKAQALKDQTISIARTLIPKTEEISKIIQAQVSHNDEVVKSSLKSSADYANAGIRSSLLINIIAIIIGIVISVFLTRMIRNPILLMVGGTQKLADGDFTGSMEVKSSDEIGELFNSLKKMKTNFHDIILGIKNASGELSESAKQLAAQAQQTSAGASETAATMGEIASTVDNMAQNTQVVSNQADIASEHAAKGYQGIELVTGQMEEISAATTQVSASIDALSTAINKIGQFVEVITNIADQTNLLALNAAIEAARAGDAGRGFAVVAEEVRKLAEQSAQSTKEIKQLIQDIETQSNQAVQAMASGSEKVEQGNRIVGEVGQNFNEIIKVVQELTDQVQNVAASAEQVAAGVQNVAGTTQEQTAAMEEVSAATENLNKLADDLDSIVVKFKL